ncbi:hypothetical protein BGW80DRAFT_1320619 [Lactifluus volemus]|nr:hypothetical protein BGW80DRAFT_1320619 [Lactifluus volemus]
MARTDAPLLHTMQIAFFNQLVFRIQQLLRFIGHTQKHMSFDTARIHSDTPHITMALSSTRRTSLIDWLTFKISCRGVDWQVSSLTQLCNQLSESFVMSSIEILTINAIQVISPLTLEDEDVMDATQWLELFHPFTAVHTLSISQAMVSHVVSALRGLGEESSMEVLPALDSLYLEKYRESGSEQPDIEPFIIARHRCNYPVNIYR